ncbi:MAG: hypothetical protein AAGK79_16040 [Pseudomonadota bacterium]
MTTETIRLREPSQQTIICPPLRVLRSVEFNLKQAKQLTALGLSAGKTVNWVFMQLYSNHEYLLLDHKGNVIDIQSDDPKMLYVMDSLGGKECLDSVMKRYLKRAKGNHQNRLPRHLVFFVTMVFHALEVHRREQERKIDG